MTDVVIKQIQGADDKHYWIVFTLIGEIEKRCDSLEDAESHCNENGYTYEIVLLVEKK